MYLLFVSPLLLTLSLFLSKNLVKGTLAVPATSTRNAAAALAWLVVVGVVLLQDDLGAENGFGVNNRPGDHFVIARPRSVLVALARVLDHFSAARPRVAAAAAFLITTICRWCVFIVLRAALPEVAAHPPKADDGHCDCGDGYGKHSH